MMINQHGGAHGETRVVDHFDATDLGAPFKVILVRSVEASFDANSGEMVSYKIPDPDGLLRTVVLTRVLHKRKLSGHEIKFLRKAVGLKQKDLANSIEISAEHLSRCEKGAVPLSPGSEKLLRLFLFKTAIKHHKMKDCEAKQKLEKALDDLFDTITPHAVLAGDEELVLSFYRSSPASINGKVAANDSECEPAWQDEHDLAA